MMTRPLHVAFIWHLHQPYYQDDLSHTFVLPWVRLRCAKDYLKMLDVLEAYPELRQTFNFVPSLLDQIQAYVAGESVDVYRELTERPAADLNEEERTFLLRYMAESTEIRRVRQYPRYLELLSRKEQAQGQPLAELARLFSDGELRDLQVWFNLSWFDPRYLDAEPLRELVRRGRNFTEADKVVVLDAQRELMRRVLPRYRAARERGQVELITSPYTHPILPLLEGAAQARRASPGLVLPDRPFAHPEDVDAQLQLGIGAFTRHFGFAPQGLWPPEAAISEGVVTAAARQGFRWLISDETVLARSLDTTIARDADGHVLRPEVLYRPYRFDQDGNGMVLVFRDAKLSNLIGFDYQNYAPEQAADDLVARLKTIHQRQDASGAPLLVPIALDGENCWEFYERNGNPFLDALYSRLEAEASLVTTTVGAFLGPMEGIRPLARIFPGSWIDGALSTWIGDAEHNRAWDLLEEARGAVQAAQPMAPEEQARAWKEIWIAEGSDWFWWFGQQHDSGIDVIWDNLFRLHLRNAYQLLGQVPSPALYRPIVSRSAPAPGKRPERKISPRLETGVLDEAEWQAGGYLDASALFGAMHPPRGLIRRVWFGTDDRQLYLRFDLLPQAARRARTLQVFLSGPAPARQERLDPVGPLALVDFGFDPQFVLRGVIDGTQTALRLYRLQDARVAEPLLEAAVPIAPALAFALPFRVLGSQPGDGVSMAAVVTEGERLVEVLPPSGAIRLRVPGKAVPAQAQPRDPLRVLLVSAEVAPFAKVGGLADVASALPKALRELGHDVRVVMPRYGMIDPARYGLEVAGRALPVPLALQRVPADVWRGMLGRDVPIYFIDNAQFFGRDGMYGFWDDDARFIYFSRAALEMCKLLDFKPQVIHVNDWHTAVIPNMLARLYADDPFFAETATVLTVHNLAFQGVFGYGTLHLANLDPWGLIKPGIAALDDIVNLLGRGVYFADAVNTVSERYAQEVLTPEYGEKMDPLLRAFQQKLFGILNGIDYEIFDPATDSHLAARYDASSIDRKVLNKTALQRELGLPEQAGIPVIGLISRLYDQKGLDLIANLMWGLMRLPIQLVVLGAGDGRYEEMFRAAARDNPEKVAATIGFDPVLAQHIYAGADLFLMPSRFEPCGLGQLISLRYGTIPIVRATGGLADTIRDWDPVRQSGNGFVFEAYDHWDLYAAIVRALETHRQPDLWGRLQQNAMATDVSWDRSAGRYVQLYATAVENHREAHDFAVGGFPW